MYRSADTTYITTSSIHRPSYSRETGTSLVSQMDAEECSLCIVCSVFLSSRERERVYIGGYIAEE